MAGVLTGFGVIAFVIFVGWLLAKLKIVRGDDRIILNKVAFFAASPALLFTVLAQADLAVVFTGSLATHAVAVVVVGVAAGILMWAGGTRDRGRLVMGATSGVYANANNIGLPVAVYVIGDGQYVAPLLVLQLVVMAPLLMAYLDGLGSGGVRFWTVVRQPFINPIVLG
ncbi:MAG: AEC family transporter, partial [Propionibacterium sp.]|nr:AEC family transporter [Propionibacterium sp.]